MSALLAVAVVALGYAIQLNNGAYTPEALRLVTIALVACLAAVVLPGWRSIERRGDGPAIFILGATLAFQVGVILSSPAGVYLRVGAEAYDTHHRAVAVLAVLAAAGLSTRPWLSQLRMPLILAVYFYLGVWLIKASPVPRIDVYAFHEEAFRALSAHANPYASTMPNIYGHSAWYAEGVVQDGRILVGFLYPPLSLLLAWPAHLLFSDYRYAMLAAITLSAAFMAYARPGRLGMTVAAVFLTTPRGLLVLEQGWTEPFVVLLLSATVFCACRAPKMTSGALGLLLAVKQYAIFLLPLAVLMIGVDRSWKKYAAFLSKAGLVAALVTLPLALWNVRAFVQSVVVFQGKQPFRADALSYMAWSAENGVPKLPQWASFAMALVALAIALWRAPRTPTGFAAGAALVMLAFFSFAKQAFCNYYFMIVGVACCAIAALHAPPRDPS